MSVPWDELPLELEAPESFSFYKDCIDRACPIPLEVINPWLTGQRQLRRGRRDGLIIARGQRSIPVGYTDNAPVMINLSLWDEYSNKTSFTLEACVDRSIKQRYEQKDRERRHNATRQPLFAHNLGDLATERKPLHDSSSAEYGPAVLSTDDWPLGDC